MAGSSSQRSWSGRAPLGLLGMLALIGLGEALVLRAEPGLAAIEARDWNQAADRIAWPEARSAAVACFGDSLVKLGVRPTILRERLGEDRPACNLALCAGRAPASYFLLRRLLESGARPSAVVLDANPSFLAEPPESAARLYAELLRPGEVRELAVAAGRPDVASTILALQALPSARNRFEVRRALVGPGSGRASLAARAEANASMGRHWREHLGAQVMPKAAQPLTADPAAWAWVKAGPAPPDPTNLAYLAAFFELARSRDIPAFWLLPPVHPGLAARQAALGQDAAVDALVATMLARFPGVVVVDARPARYDAADFLDMAHLDVDGSARLSAALGDVLADRLARPDGPRVVALPPADLIRTVVR